MPKKFLPFLPAVIFTAVLAVYFLANPRPSNLFQHFVFMADSFLYGHFDMINLPWHYGDSIIIDNKAYSQFGPSPAFLLLPLVYFLKTAISQTYVSMIFGAFNAVLVFILLGRLKVAGIAKKLFLTLFFAFGTVHFSAAATGSTWFFAHIIAVFFLLLALIENFGKKRPILMGLLFSLSVLSRQTVLFSLPFFLLYFKKEVSYTDFFRKLTIFFLVALPLFIFGGYYNFARFGSIFEDGRYYVYLNYINFSGPYTFARIGNPDFATGMLDLRNIPLHLYTLFFMPPDFSSVFPFVRPSPYGLSVILTSPLFFYAVSAKRNFLVKASWLAVLLIAAADFLWFSQGYVQFGYRYLLDFIPFLMILLAYGITNLSNFKIFLLFWSVIINAWGALFLRV